MCPDTLQAPPWRYAGFLRLLWRIDTHAEIGGDAREERLAKNEVLFRSVNEAIEQQAVRFGGGNHVYDFICERSSQACIERISLTLGEYEHIRAAGTRFVVVPGHENVEVELVVETTSQYQVVEKDGAAGIVAEHTDPRDGDLP